ncbi:hypothetical protein E2C01_060209 [Portunus trituberculatus]|uniref:Uncharacterized protein n=1 Tax=Portunus trituberculatus TaxID=210409 RepID=A0A5B7H833_PORTR|nr:hypothetical protein [Portunus trituberculatus]
MHQSSEREDARAATAPMAQSHYIYMTQPFSPAKCNTLGQAPCKCFAQQIQHETKDSTKGAGTTVLADAAANAAADSSTVTILLLH